MNNSIFCSIFILLIASNFKAQMHIQGGLKLGDETSLLKAGTMRWNGLDFQVWNEITWVSLSGNARMDSVADINGNVYKTIRIGSIDIMTENLRVTHYNNGDEINWTVNNNAWIQDTLGAWCHYDNNHNYESSFGKLYNWYAIDTDLLCPDGWSILYDWNYMIDQLGGASTAGGRLKETGLDGWINENIGADNESGFTGRGGGYRDQNGLFHDLGELGGWWSSKEVNGDIELLFLLNDAIKADISTGHKNLGLSIRCYRQ